MRKTLLLLLSIWVVLPFAQGVQAAVVCPSIHGTWLIDPSTGLRQPGIHVNVEQPQTVTITAEIFSQCAGPACPRERGCAGDAIGAMSGDLDLPAGEKRGVFVAFADEVPEGTILCIKWSVGTCPVFDSCYRAFDCPVEPNSSNAGSDVEGVPLGLVLASQ